MDAFSVSRVPSTDTWPTRYIVSADFHMFTSIHAHLRAPGRTKLIGSTSRSALTELQLKLISQDGGVFVDADDFEVNIRPSMSPRG